MVITLILEKEHLKKVSLFKEVRNWLLYFISQTFFFLHLQEKQAGFYDNIIKVIRGEPEYFKAAFYGLGFPTFLRVSMKKKMTRPQSPLLIFI